MAKPIKLSVSDLTELNEKIKKSKNNLLKCAKAVVDKTCRIGLVDNYSSATQMETTVQGYTVKGGIKAPAEVKFAEYGTGIYSEKGHIGSTTTFIESGFNKWYVPVNEVKHNVNYPVIQIDGEDYYIARPQVAQHRFYKCSERMRRQIRQIALDEFIGGTNGITKYLQ